MKTFQRFCEEISQARATEAQRKQMAIQRSREEIENSRKQEEIARRQAQVAAERERLENQMRMQQQRINDLEKRQAQQEQQ